MKIKYHSETIRTIEIFFTEKECEELIFISEQKRYYEVTVSLLSGAKL